MIVFENNAEGGTAGANVTTANSGGGSGTAFPLVNVVSPGTVTYSDQLPLTGTMSYRLANNTSSGQGNLFRVTNSGLNTYAQRFKHRFDRLPSATSVIFTSGSGSGTTTAKNLIIGTDGRLGIQNAAGTITMFGPAIPVNTTIHIESVFVKGTTTSNGTAKVRWYTTNPNSPEASFESTAFNTGTAAVVRMQWGRVSGNWPSLVQTLDDFVITDESSFIGPPANNKGWRLWDGSAETALGEPSGVWNGTALVPVTYNVT